LQQLVLNRFRTSFLVAALAVLLLLPLWVVRYPPLLDYPDHLARSFIIFHLDDPTCRFRSFYSTEWGAYPKPLPAFAEYSVQMPAA